MKTKVVLISGKKQHGKNTVADLLRSAGRSKGYNVVEMAFADPLKESAQLIFRLTARQIWNGAEKERFDPRWNMTPREIMQKLGTEIGRNISPDVWVLNLCYRIQEANFDKNCPNPTLVLVTDTRFPNEVELPKKILGEVVTIRVNRPGMPATAFDSHPSETSLDSYTDWNYTVTNNGSLEQLKQVVELIANELMNEA
jgi:hypothetical protein